MGTTEIQPGIRRIQLDMPLVGRLSPCVLRCNVYAIKTDAGITLFDCGPWETIAALESALNGERVNQIYLTHGHADHAGSGSYWIKKGAKVLAPQEEYTLLTAGGPANAPRTFRYSGFKPTECLQPNCRITSGKMIDFVMIRVPGHTLGSVCYYDESNDILVSGDLLFGPIWGHMVTFLLEVATSISQPKVYVQRQLESLDRLITDGIIKNSTLILPGHGPVYQVENRKSGVSRSQGILHLCCKLKG